MAKDFLWPQLIALPYFRGTLRSIEARLMHAVELPGPVLDIGSGDGQFASVTYDQLLDVGIDPSFVVMQEARKFGGYRSLVQADGAALPFPDGYFASAVSNSVLEHIPHLDKVLQDIGRVLRPGAPMAFTVPNPGYRSELSIPRRLRRIGLDRLAQVYTDWFMKVTRTINMEYEDGWANRLERAGFTVEKTWRYFSPAALGMLEWGHYFGVPCVVARWLTKRWILAPKRWNLFVTDHLVRRYYEEPFSNEGTYSFYLVRKL